MYDHIRTVAMSCHRVLFAILYDYDISLESFAGVPRERGPHLNSPKFMHGMLDRISTVCAYAEYYGCLPKVAKFMTDRLVEYPYFWQTIADKPIKYLVLAQRLRSPRVYADALRHIISDPHCGYENVAECLGIAEAQARGLFSPLLCRSQEEARKLEHNLLRLQLCETWSEFSCVTYAVHTTFFNKIRYERKNRSEGQKTDERSDLLARSIYGQWLVQQMTGEYLYIFNKRRSERAGPFNAAVVKLEEAAVSQDPTALFGHQVPTRISSIFRLGRRYSPPKQVAASLTEIVQKAAGIIADAFEVRTVEEDGKTLTYRRAEFDAHGEYFTYLPLDENDVPWKDEPAWEDPPVVPATINMQAVSDELAQSLGLKA